MTNDARELLERALKLSRDARAALAAGLIDSLDEGRDDDPVEVERAWRDEIAQRVRDVMEGRVQTIDFDEAIERARRELRR